MFASGATSSMYRRNPIAAFTARSSFATRSGGTDTPAASVGLCLGLTAAPFDVAFDERGVAFLIYVSAVAVVARTMA